MMSRRQQLKIVLGYTVAASWVIGSFELVRIAMHSKLPLLCREHPVDAFAWVWSSALALQEG